MCVQRLNPNARIEAQGHESRDEMIVLSVGSRPPYFAQVDEGNKVP